MALEPRRGSYVVARPSALVSRMLLAFSAFCGVAAVCSGVPDLEFPLALFGVPLGLMTLLVRRSLYRENWPVRGRRGDVVVGLDGVAVDGALVAPRAAIDEAFYQPRTRRRGSQVGRLRDRRRNVLLDIDVANEFEAVGLLEALGMDAMQHRARFTGASFLGQTPWRRHLVVLAIIATIFFGAFERAPFLFVLFGVLIALAELPSRVDVGADGVLVSWLGTRRFVSFDDVIEAQAEGHGTIRLVKNDRRFHDVVIGHATKKRHADEIAMRRDVVLARVREVLAARQKAGGARDVAVRVGCGGRGREAWLHDLRKLRDADAGYRATAVREEDLWRLVEDLAAPADARAAAALLLRRSLDVETRTRLRVAADATALPKLRVALEVASSSVDEAAVEEALGALVDERPLQAAKAKA